MGLFGVGSSIIRVGAGPEAAAAREAVENIGRALETEFRDTPGEYFVLQAAGMLFASQHGAVKGVEPVHSMDESLARARQIMGAFSDTPLTNPRVLDAQARIVYEQLREAAGKGVQAPLLIGHLSSYLHYVDNVYLRRRMRNDTLALCHEVGLKPPWFTERYVSRFGRTIVWIVVNVFLLFAVAITNGFLVFFLALLASFLLSSWMLTSFLVRPQPRMAHIGAFTKIALATIGTTCAVLWIYGNPFYIGATPGVLIYEMRILSRYNFGCVAAFCLPLVSLLPIILISHTSYTELVVSNEWYRIDDLLGYLVACAALVAAILLVKRDNRNLSPLVGKGPDSFLQEGADIAQRSFAVKVLFTMLMLPFVGVALGTFIGVYRGNWKLGGLLGLMAGSMVSVIGQMVFFKWKVK